MRRAADRVHRPLAGRRGLRVIPGITSVWQISGSFPEMPSTTAPPGAARRDTAGEPPARRDSGHHGAAGFCRARCFRRDIMVNEVSKQASWATQTIRRYHYRTREGAELAPMYVSSWFLASGKLVVRGRVPSSGVAEDLPRSSWSRSYPKTTTSPASCATAGASSYRLVGMRKRSR